MTARVLLDASGLKIVKPGVDVFSGGLTPRDYHFSSDGQGFDLLATGTVSITTYGQTVNYPMGDLGYTPLLVLMRIEDASWSHNNWFKITEDYDSSVPEYLGITAYSAGFSYYFNSAKFRVYPAGSMFTLRYLIFAPPLTTDAPSYV